MDSQGIEQSQASNDAFWRSTMEEDPGVLGVPRERAEEISNHHEAEEQNRFVQFGHPYIPFS